MLANRLRKRRRHLRKWARRTGVTCYRLYERDIPEAPCIVDWYDGEAVGWLYSRTRDETPEEDAAWRRCAVEEIRAGLDLEPEQMFVKQRQRQRRRQEGEGQYERIARRGQVRIVEESGLRFEVNLSDYLDTGLFLDHRDTRALVRERAAGKRVLNLFAYTGAFTCYAAAGGAVATRTVDLSRTYCEWAARNLRHNGFEPGRRHVIEPRDCLELLAGEPGGEADFFDLIVCDPPTFSNSKRMAAGSFSVERDHPWLLARAARRLRPGGELLFSTNSRRFALREAELPERLEVTEISEQTVPEDFRNRKIHRAWWMRPIALLVALVWLLGISRISPAWEPAAVDADSKPAGYLFAHMTKKEYGRRDGR